jgi:YggT family protein
MSYLVHHPLYALALLYVVALVGRALLSWFPIEPRSPLGSVNHVLWVITEPYVSLFRRVVPPLGMFDVSYMLAVVVVWLVAELLLARVTV